jgi:hypothetical protein
VSTFGAIPFRTHGTHGFGFGLHSTGFGLHGGGGGGLHGSGGGGAGVLHDGLEQLSVIICGSCVATTSSAIVYIVNAVKLSKTILFIVYSPVCKFLINRIK